MVVATWSHASGQPENKRGAIPKGASDAEKSSASDMGLSFTIRLDILDVSVWGKKPLVPEGECIPTMIRPVASVGFPIPGTGPLA